MDEKDHTLAVANPADTLAVTITQKPRSYQYLWAIIIMILVGFVVVLSVMVSRQTQDNTWLITLIIGFLTTTTGSVLTYMKAQETHLSVNSRLDAWMKAAKELSREQGFQAGRSPEGVSLLPHEPAVPGDAPVP